MQLDEKKNLLFTGKSRRFQTEAFSYLTLI